MSAQQTIYDRIKGDLQDDKILQNVTLERLWYYFEVIKDITGSGGANFSYGTGEPSGGSDGDYYIRTDALQIWYNNGGTWEVVLSPTPIPLTGDQFKALIDAPSGIINGQLYDVTQDGGDAYQLPVSITGMYVTGGNNQFLSGVLAKITLTGKLEYATYYTSDNDIFQNSIATMSVDLAQAYFTGNDIQNSTVIVNTDYIIDNSGATQLPTGISRIKGRAVLDPSGNVVWDKANCEAWVTALSTYVPCTYDVATNKVFCKYIAWAGNISQTGGGDAVIDLTFVNLLGETPVFDASAVGVLDILTTTWNWTNHRVIMYSPHYFDGTNLWAPTMNFGTATQLQMFMVKNNADLADDIYNNQYIELSVIISNL